MLKTHKPLEKKVVQPSNLNNGVNYGHKNLKLMELNYRRNLESDYTERMEELYKAFDYESNSEYYWSNPELSILYGSPLYQQASVAQKKALNHLYWVQFYYATAATEANTILFNQITSNAFFPFSEYGVLCHTLDVETSQERYHVDAFHTIGYITEKALLDEPVFYHTLPAKGNRIGKDQAIHKGIAGRAAQPLIMNLLKINLSDSPFLASQYYAARGVGNLHLKNKEYSYSQYFKQLEQKGEFIPAPTAVSRYHLLDESFHTTTSQLISHEIYKDFPQPSAYEKFIANLMIHMLQHNVLKSLSGVIPGATAGDGDFIMSWIYKLLRSRLFSMDQTEALEWMQKCFCQEHDGFHVSAKYHQHLQRDIQKFLDGLDYLWPSNREMHRMAAGGAIEQAISNNIRDFKKLTQSL
ncbi:hypothetical protein [Leptolyngbya sp. 7M]|uniref:hypothetical protein n=1 Tax=Leptolyngbya sp. 7M TaxID=2812896 RepID=UPI001B8D5859|nr:hypothetical protein [Leptolyngbya sp. 7M]QYO67172.1 hypothetical protein JVX88_10425 [Leptolyngbya sp. 7M]